MDFVSDNASSGPFIEFVRARGTQAAPATVQDGDSVANIQAGAYDATLPTAWPVGGIEFEIDGVATPGTNFPGRITFSTTPAGALSASRMTIDSTGLVTILSRANIPAAANNVYLYGGDTAIYSTNNGFNWFIGKSAGNFATTGDGNTGIGFGALIGLTSGSSNIAIGYNAGCGFTTLPITSPLALVL
jgi:hypothetical protein